MSKSVIKDVKINGKNVRIFNIGTSKPSPSGIDIVIINRCGDELVDHNAAAVNFLRTLYAFLAGMVNQKIWEICKEEPDRHHTLESTFWGDFKRR